MTVPSTTEAIEALRAERRHPDLFGGFGPLALAVALLVAMVLLIPSVAPEQIVEQPATSASTTAVDTAGGGR